MLQVPKVNDWHVVTQDRLYAALKVLWGEERPRVMVDLGSHACHGRFCNVSDALLFLQAFHAPGTLAIGVDMVEHFASDLQYRFDYVEPYRSMADVEKRSYLRYLDTKDDIAIDATGAFRGHLGCCVDDSSWCNKWGLEKAGYDHICRSVRQYLSVTNRSRDVPDEHVYAWNWTHSPETLWGVFNRTPGAKYKLMSERVDTLWRRELGGRHIDFLKVDTDTPWTSMGLESLLRRRGVSIMTIEVDGAWGGLQPNWGGVTRVDQLVWFARSAGYDAFMKTPCRAINRSFGSMELGSSYHRATWMQPLANKSFFAPTGYYAQQRGRTGIQDLMFVLRESPQADTESAIAQADATGGAGEAGWAGSFVRRLQELTAADCTEAERSLIRR